jgi:hypothetical protein
MRSPRSLKRAVAFRVFLSDHRALFFMAARVGIRQMRSQPAMQQTNIARMTVGRLVADSSTTRKKCLRFVASRIV